MPTKLEKLKNLRTSAPKPFGLYSATCIGLDGGLSHYLNNFQESNFTDFAAGLKVYRNSDYVPQKSKSKIIKKKGRVKLLEFATVGEPILLIPSLVNKYYIFDLYKENSLIRHLKAQGFRPFVIDWGAPQENKNKIDFQELIEDYVLYFSDFLNKELKSKIHLLGYCMGGTFALIAAHEVQNYYKSLTLVSTPVDFTKMPFKGMIQFYNNFYLQYLENTNVSAELIQTLFFMLDCEGVLKRIKSFTDIKDKKQMERMVALEDWLSDCIDVDNTIAKDILSLWYVKNELYKHNIALNKITLPTYLITANNDSIVPAESSEELLSQLPNIKHIKVDSGHIGVMAGRKSISDFYNVITKELLSI
jgi:polyhydroxyalkanoate synthase subunit PhaC